jgi:hypothetical protein
MLSSFLGVLPIFIPPLGALTLYHVIKVHISNVDLMSAYEGEDCHLRLS